VQNAVPTADGWLRIRLVVRLGSPGPVRFGVATIDPQRIYDHLFQAEDSSATRTIVLSESGRLQMAAAPSVYPIDSALFVPPGSPSFGIASTECRGLDLTYAYDKLHQAGWTLVVVPVAFRDEGWLAGFRLPLLGFSLLLVAALSIVVVNRAGGIVRSQMDSDRTRAQLEHAAKLASVGELAAGIAHEINNPLAVINEEAGLMADFLNPQLAERPSDSVLVRHLDSIQEAVFRCRDITRRLLRFVRKTDVDLRPHNIHALIDAVIDGPLGAEIVISNATIVRQYDHAIPGIPTDRNQFHQVMVNILKNAVDALEGRNGTVTITTSVKVQQVRVAIADTGHGMTPEQMEQLFVPFYTTKGVGKGTGLGLSVSYGIMCSLGGSIEVASDVGRGSVFTLVLPLGT
jgi:two-component system NtrC family sensor kinase